MDIQAEQSRLANAIIYFAQNTERCGKIKLFKLLYLLDFEHFKVTGKTVTGLTYQAWKFGPVPPKVLESWDDPDCPIAPGCHVEEEPVFDHIRQTVKIDSATRFDDSDFTQRQLRIMQDLAARYRDTTAPQMIDITHQENGAWDKVWRSGEGAYQVIPYEFGISDNAPEREHLLSVSEEIQARRAAIERQSKNPHEAR